MRSCLLVSGPSLVPQEGLLFVFSPLLASQQGEEAISAQVLAVLLPVANKHIPS